MCRRVASSSGLGGKQFFAERLACDFIGPVGIGIEAHERCIDIGQVLFDGIEVERALMCVHALIVDPQIAGRRKERRGACIVPT